MLSEGAAAAVYRHLEAEDRAADARDERRDELVAERLEAIRDDAVAFAETLEDIDFAALYAALQTFHRNPDPAACSALTKVLSAAAQQHAQAWAQREVRRPLVAEYEPEDCR